MIDCLDLKGCLIVPDFVLCDEVTVAVALKVGVIDMLVVRIDMTAGFAALFVAGFGIVAGH